MLKRLIHLFKTHKVIRGMIAYGTLWPTGCMIEQTIVERRNLFTYDYHRCLRYSIFGGFIMAPLLYPWVRFLSIMYPKNDLKISIWKAVIEQLCFEPFSISTFLFVISLMEGKSREDAVNEVCEKFFHAYKIAIIYWPILQTINFWMIPVKNQVVFVSIFSLIWSTILAYIKAQGKNGKMDG